MKTQQTPTKKSSLLTTAFLALSFVFLSGFQTAPAKAEPQTLSHNGVTYEYDEASGYWINDDLGICLDPSLIVAPSNNISPEAS